MSDQWGGEERREIAALSEDVMERIAERAAQKAVQQITNQVYLQVGKSVLSKVFYVVGVVTIGLVLWAQSHGWLKVPS